MGQRNNSRDRVLSTSREPVEDSDCSEKFSANSSDVRGEKACIYAENSDFPQGENLVEILRFTHFVKHTSFASNGKKGRKKQIVDGIDVSVVLHLV